MKRKAIVCVVTRNYGHFALALAESVAQHEPDVDYFVCFVDRPSFDCESAFEGRGKVFYADQLGIPQWNRFAFQYTPFELSCALKPAALKHVADQGYEQIVYLDGDMRLQGSLDAVWEALDHSSIVLTPHLLKPFPDDGGRPGENLFLMAGTFNAGFVAISNDENSQGFIDWWSKCLAKQGHKDLAGSLFVDQKWLSLVPGLFPSVHLLRDPGYNTGHWTIAQYPLSFADDGKPSIGSHEIRLFHFSNLSPGGLGEYDHCQDRTTYADEPVLQHLVKEYHEAIGRYEQVFASESTCDFATCHSGTEIHPAWREAIRRDHPLFRSIEDPFEVGSQPLLLAKFRSVEGKAKKWRQDWRLKGIPSANEKQQDGTKRLKRQVKKILRSFTKRKKAA